ncbi:MAG: hypothetical protein EBS28_00700 [Chlamydiae bacterium]|nr:hypothetical protein [Chlamydiota bacterium]
MVDSKCWQATNRFNPFFSLISLKKAPKILGPFFYPVAVKLLNLFLVIFYNKCYKKEKEGLPPAPPQPK